MPALVVENLACRRGTRLLFEGLEFSLEAGRALLLGGGNGSGKSSLLRTLALLLRPAAGRILWQGNDVGEDREAWRRQLGWLGHSDAVKPELTVGETLALALRLDGRDSGPAAGRPAERCQAALASFGLEDLASRSCRHLSAGQRRRLSLARLLACAAPVWLLDEPAAALDAASSAALHRAIDAHLDRGGLALIASHGDIHLDRAGQLRLEDWKPRHASAGDWAA